jgi:hypothetical protein
MNIPLWILIVWLILSLLGAGVIGFFVGVFFTAGAIKKEE